MGLFSNNGEANGNDAKSRKTKTPRSGAAGGFRGQVQTLEDRCVPATAFTLDDNALVSFDTANPGAASAPLAITGLAMGDNLVGIDFRPQNGQLYGLGYDGTDGSIRLYNISVKTGVATAIGADIVPGMNGFVAADGMTAVRVGVDANTRFGVDINPAVDRLRIVTSNGQNFRMNPNTGGIIDGNLNMMMAPAGVNMDGAVSGGTTTVEGTAYTNNVPNNGGITTQYTLDAMTNSLFIQNPPNSGAQTLPLVVTLGGAPLDFTEVAGFDIPVGVNAPASNMGAPGSGFAALTVGGATNLYSINLATGAATLVGPLDPGLLDGLALQEEAVAGGVAAVSLSSDATQLLRFNTATPGTVTSVAIPAPGMMGGVAIGEVLVGIDFRP
ncbi:MAG: DUF4394 domain-containing protein, partial [Planctomycetia bacterium]